MSHAVSTLYGMRECTDGEAGRTICSFIRFPSSSIVRILKSMPIVVINEGVHASSQKRSKRHDLPTPRHKDIVHVRLRVSMIEYVHLSHQ